MNYLKEVSDDLATSDIKRIANSILKMKMLCNVAIYFTSINCFLVIG